MRARVIALGLIPLIGFLANAIALKSGDTQVGRSFDSVQAETRVASASHDLKTGLLEMRAATTGFVAHPSESEVKSFASGQDLAIRSLDRIESALASSQQDVITPLRITVRDLKASFDSLVNEERALGFDETEGTTADLIAASNAIENSIHNDLSWVADDATSKLLVSLLTMRRYEIEYRLTRSPDAEKRFLDEIKHFNTLFDSIDGLPAWKEKLNGEVQKYSFTLRPMGREHRQYRAAPGPHQTRHRKRSARGRQDHRHGAGELPRRGQYVRRGAFTNTLPSSPRSPFHRC